MTEYSAVLDQVERDLKEVEDGKVKRKAVRLVEIYDELRRVAQAREQGLVDPEEVDRLRTLALRLAKEFE